MASLVGKALAKRVLNDTAKKNINSVNPFEEEVPVLDRNGHETGKTKKRKRGFPQGLTQNDLGILKKVRRRAYRLDMSLFNCCGLRFGWSSVIGFIPVIGDFIDLFMALMLVKSCQKVDGGLPATLKARMMFNVMMDFALGLVPLLGDLADAVFRANTRNAWLLETYLVKKIEAQKTGHISDPELGRIEVAPGPNQPMPAKMPANIRGGPVEPVRAYTGPRNGTPNGSYVTNGKTSRRPEMVQAAVNYGVRMVDTVSSSMRGNRSNVGVSAGHIDGRPSTGSNTSSSRSMAKTKEDMAMAALQYGARAATDAYKGRSKPAGRR